MADNIAKAIAAGWKSRPLAMVLWIIVLAGLAYGVSQTAIEAGALFTE